MSDLEIIDRLRQTVSEIGPDAPPALRWLRAEILTAISSPRVRRLQRNAHIVELAGHYASHGATARALAHYGSVVWPREQHRLAPPDGPPERRLAWMIFNVGLAVPITQQGIGLVMGESSHDKDTVVPCGVPELASIIEE